MRLYSATPRKLVHLAFAGGFLGASFGGIILLLAEGLLLKVGHTLSLTLIVAILCGFAAVGIFTTITET